MIRKRAKSQREPTIALINIVFLMLIFFLVTGTLARPLDKGLTLVRTSELEGAAPPDALVIHADGRMSWRGSDISEAGAVLSTLPETDRAVIRLVPDRDLPASRLVEIGRTLRAAGAGKVVVVTERGLE
ncbi:hypothetical protein OB2597_05445 [Pseudooceanicola batsensis HTCC2597]|uniref:Biopolymer transport protein ExbD/TolR n=1 Tax=Pseudooceanicola batsensis (strain ATCC BAA-863 / DSM 15984 / KCTC 12145 / HTCC2597) TaxID=252305 RepID=A3TSS4_PSEBH|nr:biopolymer transporter ExbD [Pseudooceanicola batsensis]EAQ04701.1 hypothetical protein OB2597_05445 [Pseudooceanicola batsensis HTCC2597]